MRTGVFALLVAFPAGVLLAAEPPSKPGRPVPTQTSCFNCHSQLDGAALEPTKRAAEDIHFLRGLSCHDCHGGDPTAIDDMEASHDPRKGWTGKPDRLHIPEFCGRCHADAAFMKQFNPHARVDQLSEYRTSVHGQKNAKGDAEVAVCIDCHGVHGIHAVSDPRSSVYPTNVADTCGRCHADEKKMGPYVIPTNQVEQYKTSVHFHALHDKADLSAPTCNDCHGSHGATPPGVESVTSVCGTCHPREATLFRETEAKTKMDLSPCIRCMVCHSNHAVLPPRDEMLGIGKDSTCTGCHAEGEPGYKAAAKMAESIGHLKGRIGQAAGLLDRAERAGMEVGEDRFALQKAQDSLVESRVLAHSFDLSRFMTAATAGIAAADGGITAGQRLFTELRHRRVGLGLSLIVIVAVIVGLAFKVKELDRHREP
jgi:hypothetical protein